MDKKREEHTMRVLQAKHGTFTPLFFFLFLGRMRRECRIFYSGLSDLLSEKCELPKSITGYEQKYYLLC